MGVPPLTYSWIKDGLSVTSGPRKVLLDNGATLKLLDVRVVDSGIYTCRASNNFGKDQREAELKVIKYDLQTGISS